MVRCKSGGDERKNPDVHSALYKSRWQRSLRGESPGEQHYRANSRVVQRSKYAFDIAPHVKEPCENER